MSSIPEYILMEVRRQIAEGMPVERIALYTRLDPSVVEEELKKVNAPSGGIPQKHVDLIRKLGLEGMPVGRIVSMTHVNESTVCEVLTKAGIAPTENLAGEQASSR